MGSILVFVFAVLAFALSARGLIAALTENVQLMSFTAPFSRRALQVARIYKITAWALLTLFLFATTAHSFWVVFKTF